MKSFLMTSLKTAPLRQGPTALLAGVCIATSAAFFTLEKKADQLFVTFGDKQHHPHILSKIHENGTLQHYNFLTSFILLKAQYHETASTKTLNKPVQSKSPNGLWLTRR